VAGVHFAAKYPLDLRCEVAYASALA
jgi:hypothetical protein